MIHLESVVDPWDHAWPAYIGSTKIIQWIMVTLGTM